MVIASPARIAPEDTLSAAMKKGSAVEHEQAEGSSYMAALLDGRMDAAGYIAYLQRLRLVYDALESTGRALADDPIASAVIDPALDRLPAIDADLQHWAPNGVPEVVSPAAAAYVERITDSVTWGGAFVAHHYTRYLGDLSGGQAIGRILDRSFDLDGAGIAFYAFDEVGKVKPYKDRYRDRLDQVGAAMSYDDRQRLVDEVRLSFGFNQALFEELSELYPGR
ncbi:heme oxygenase (biliverdin-producing) [Gordonia humi]|uniref:Heme oxygenase n=1 Tax=Gordonia humi TaxID=686429 RepID=A0A840F1G6_9ACTN|nr:biliverdin-producing heme oxygenase [Gordonia humi]MBB4137711.1 heme oxygenase [Gordonia humi]